MNPLTPAASKPWYREPWPWLLMSLPAAAVIAGLVTVWIAARSADGMVVGDYYKAGLAINQTLARDEAARAMGLVATLSGDADTLSLSLEGRLTRYPETLTLTFAHPTRQGEDQRVTLIHAGNGRYRAAMPTLADGKWIVQLSDDAGAWRLPGVLHTPFFNQSARFSAADSAVQ